MYHFPALEEAAAQLEISPTMVIMWRRIRKKPQRDGNRQRERVRKMQLEAAPSRM